jgi:hypothetical protein
MRCAGCTLSVYGRITDMYKTPNKLRLTHLKLDGFRPGAVVLFCPRCDFQYLFECAAHPICPKCDESLHVTRVTPDLIELVQSAA